MSVVERATGVLLVALSAGRAYATLLAASAATIQPVSLDFGETTVYDATLRILRGQPLYRPIAGPPYTVTPYTPLYHLAAALLRAVFGEGFGPGRVLSLVAGVLTAFLVCLLAARAADALWAGVFAGLLFLGLAFPGGTPWMGLYRVDVLGVALSAASVAVLSSGRGSGWSIVAGVLAGLALLSKQTFVAALLTGIIWLWPNYRLVARFGGSALTVVLVPCVWFELTTHAFIQNVFVALNPYELSEATNLWQQFATTQWLPLLLTATYLVLRRPWSTRNESLIFVYWLTSSIQLVGVGKVGSNHNYWIEFAAATGMLAALGAASLLRYRQPVAAAAGGLALLVLVGVVSGGGLVQVLAGGTGGVRTMAREVQDDVQMVRAGSVDPDFAGLVERVREAPGEVIADPPDVVVLADRPLFFEPLIYDVMFEEGVWSPEQAVQMICGGEVSLVVLDYALGSPHGTFGRFDAWPPPVSNALDEAMQFVGVQDHRNLYTPRAVRAQCPR